MAKKSDNKDQDILDAINSEFGSGTIVSMDCVPDKSYETISTGSLNLNQALGVGGLPRGRIVELYGPESSGKTTLALHLIANAQEKGLRCAFIDAEHALDISYAENLGVQKNLLAVSQPDSGEQALNVCDRLVRSEQFGVVVVDSVAALVPKDELEGQVGDYHVGKQARMMSQALRMLVRTTAVSDTLLVFINQTRSKIGGMGNPETTPGGNALKFYASIRMRIVRTGSTTSKGEKVSNTTKVKVVKNKCAPPFREAEFEIDFGTGISIESEIIDRAVEFGAVKKSGAWYVLTDGNKQLGQGRENAKKFLRENADLRNSLLSLVTSNRGLSGA